MILIRSYLYDINCDAPCASFHPIRGSLDKAWKRPSAQVGTADGEGVPVNGLQRCCHGFLFVHLARGICRIPVESEKRNKDMLKNVKAVVRLLDKQKRCIELLSSTPALALERTGYS